MKTVTIYMQAHYSWGLNLGANAPENTATIRRDKDGTLWFESINVANIAMADMAELLKFATSYFS